jgi:hypothetical protein
MGPQAAVTSFFDQIVVASGLANLIARAAIARACLRAGVDPARVDRFGLSRALPHLENTLRLYVPEEAEQRIEALRQLAA